MKETHSSCGLVLKREVRMSPWGDTFPETMFDGDRKRNKKESFIYTRGDRFIDDVDSRSIYYYLELHHHHMLLIAISDNQVILCYMGIRNESKCIYILYISCE